MSAILTCIIALLCVCQRKPEDEEANADDAKKLKTADVESNSVTDVPAKESDTVKDVPVMETDSVRDVAVTASVPAVTEKAADTEAVVNGCMDAGADEQAAVNGCDEKMEVTAGDSDIKVRYIFLGIFSD